MEHPVINLTALADQIGARLEGVSTENMISGVASLKRANKHEVSFFINHLHREALLNTQAAAVILASKDRHHCKVAALVMDNPYLGYARAATLLTSPIVQPKGIHPRAWVSPTAILDTTVSIGAQAVIGDNVVLGKEVVVGAGCVIEEAVRIGDYSRLVANVTLCLGTCIGQRVLIHPGAVIGADGFGLANDQGIWIKVPQLGGVIIENDVEIGANTTIDKGTLEDTIIARGVKLDNQIQIGHNVHIGEHTAIAGCVGIAGSTHIGRHCMIGGGVGIVGHIEIVDRVHITGGSIVLQSILAPGVYSSGTPLQLSQQWRRNFHHFKQFNEMIQQLKMLKKDFSKYDSNKE